MASVFDGLSGALVATFGAPVTFTKAGQSPATLAAVFREQPTEQEVADGRIMSVILPTVRVRKSDLLLSPRDIVDPGTGKTYVVLQAFPSGSPASDAFVTYLLEEVRP